MVGGGRKEVGLVLSIVFWNSTLLTPPKHITKATFVTVSGHNRHSMVFSCNTNLISCMFSCSHQSTFDRLYAREKKLYQEVRVHLKSSA